MERKKLVDKEVIQDFEDGMLSKEMEKKYGYSWAHIRKVLIKNNISFRKRGGYRMGTARKLGSKNKWGA